MSTPERLPWFPCEPGPLLGALASMRAPKQLVYMVILLRIYESGGACPDTIDALSTRTKLNRKVVTEAIEELLQEGRLFRADGGIHNPKADRVMGDTVALREKRKRASSKAVSAAAEKRKENQQTEPTKRDETVDQPSTHLHLHKQEQDSLFPDGNRAPEPESKSAAMQAPPLDAEADYYRRGREVLGNGAGGMLTKLLRAKGGNLALARAAIEQASTRGDAREYVGAMLRGTNETDRNGGGKVGFAGLSAQLRRNVEQKRAAAFDLSEAAGRSPEDRR